jgi:Rieske Fe-S protein
VIDDSAVSPLDRRTLLRGAVAAGLAVPLVAGCGGGDSSSSGDNASSSPQPQPSSDSPDDSGAGSGSDDSSGGDSGGSSHEGTELADTSAIPKGGGKVFADEKVVVTQPKAGDFKCFTAVCTHQGCLVAMVSGGTINCNCHGSRYNISTGAVEVGPAPSPLAVKKIKVEDHEIYLV